MPGFYHHPRTVDDLVDMMAGRILDRMGVENDLFRRWQGDPLAQLTGAEIVLKVLRDQDVDVIFGYPGGAVLPIYDEIFKTNELRHVLVRHEQGAALMADGFSRISGAPSVCLVTNGPGVLNLTYGIASAYVANSPVVVLAPSASRSHQYRDSTQEFDQVSLFRPITKAAFPVNTIERLPDALHHAFRVATSGKMGPVLLDIPRDLLPGADIDLLAVGEQSTEELLRSLHARLASEGSIERIMLVEESKQPVLRARVRGLWLDIQAASSAAENLSSARALECAEVEAAVRTLLRCHLIHAPQRRARRMPCVCIVTPR